MPSTMTLIRRKCLRCGYLWWPRQSVRPAACPACKSRRYDTPFPDKGTCDANPK